MQKAAGESDASPYAWRVWVALLLGVVAGALLFGPLGLGGAATPPPRQEAAVQEGEVKPPQVSPAWLPPFARVSPDFYPLPKSEVSPLPVDPEVGFFEPGEDYLSIPEVVTPAWQERVRQTLRDFLRPRPPGTPVIVQSSPSPVALGDVSLIWLRFEVSDGHRIRGALLTPPGSKHAGPLVVVLHGHGPGLPLVLDPASYQKGIALELARAGFLVLALETRGFGASGFPALEHRAYVQRLRLQGEEFHGQVVSDNLEILRWARESVVYDGRIALVGGSMGGFAAMFLSALGEPFDACLVSGVGGSWRLGLSSFDMCPGSNIPGLLKVLDEEQVFAAMSCRSIALELGRYDPILGAANLPDHGKGLLAVAQRRGVAMEIHIFEGTHEHDRNYIIDYLRRTFGVDAEAHPE